MKDFSSDLNLDVLHSKKKNEIGLWLAWPKSSSINPKLSLIVEYISDSEHRKKFQ